MTSRRTVRVVTPSRSASSGAVQVGRAWRSESRRYAVVGGTGAFAGLAGSGTYPLGHGTKEWEWSLA